MQFGRYGTIINDVAGYREIHDYKNLPIDQRFKIFRERLDDYGNKTQCDPLRALWDIHSMLVQDQGLKDCLLNYLQDDYGLKNILADEKYPEFMPFIDKGIGGDCFLNKPSERKKAKSWHQRSKLPKFVDYMIDWRFVAQSIVAYVKDYNDMIAQYESIAQGKIPPIY